MRKILFNFVILLSLSTQAFSVETTSSSLLEDPLHLLNSSRKKSSKIHGKNSVPTPRIFQNPFMAPNNFSEIHNNSFQTDTLSVAGPGRSKSCLTQSALINPPTGIAGTLAFNSQGQIITIRSAVTSPTENTNTILLIDPITLDVIASTALPSLFSTSDTSFAGGGYFYLDNLDRVVCVTTTQQIRIYALENNQFVLVTLYDLTSTLNDATDVLNSVLPDSLGNLWFISQAAKVGYVNPTTGAISIANIRLLPNADPTETNTKSFASDAKRGVYIVTDHALYRFEATSFGPLSTWRTPYDRGTRIKPGQIQQGSGTTPTLFNDFKGNEFVTIADNSDPFLHVLVFERKTGRLVIEQAVFQTLPFQNSCENSLIAVNRSIIVENNYGNISLTSTLGPLTTVPGIARVDFDPKRGCSQVTWENLEISIPSVVTQLSTKDGLIYTYAKDSKSWFFAALDYRTGKIFSKVRLSQGILVDLLANNFYSGLNIGPDKTAYVGVLGGIVAWRPKTKTIKRQNFSH